MPSFHRIIWFHNQTSAHQYPNARELAAAFEISGRQAQRDIEYLRDSLNAPLVYCARKKGYTYSEDFSIPMFFLSESEKAMLEGMKKRYMKLNSMGYSEYGRQADVIGRLTQTGKPWLRTLKEPYTAMIQFTDGRIHTSPLDCFVCRFFENNTAEYSFYEPEMFIGALLGSGLDFRILKPNWLREYLKDRLERILEVL